MKRLVSFALFLLLMPAVARADYFQLIAGDGRNYVAYAQILVDGRPMGYTDKYGRIGVHLQPGTYSGEIRYGNASVPVSFTIDGSPSLKILRIVF